MQGSAVSFGIVLLALLLAAVVGGTFGLVTAFGGSRELALGAAAGSALLLQLGRWAWQSHCARRRRPTHRRR